MIWEEEISCHLSISHPPRQRVNWARVRAKAHSNRPTTIVLILATRMVADSKEEPESNVRRLGAFSVAILSFAAVAGGPFGIEAAVGAAGPLPVIIGCVVLAFAWSATQCLVAAELATMYSCNGGAITWGVKGLGPHAGFVNAMNVLASAACNLPLYPVLFASYVQQLVPSLSESAVFGIKLAVLLLTVSLNSFGLQAVEVAATAFSIIVQLPFIVMPIAAVVYGNSFDWPAVLTTAPGFQSQLSLFIATLCWNAQGMCAFHATGFC